MKKVGSYSVTPHPPPQNLKPEVGVLLTLPQYLPQNGMFKHGRHMCVEGVSVQSKGLREDTRSRLDYCLSSEVCGSVSVPLTENIIKGEFLFINSLIFKTNLILSGFFLRRFVFILSKF